MQVSYQTYSIHMISLRKLKNDTFYLGHDFSKYKNRTDIKNADHDYEFV